METDFGLPFTDFGARQYSHSLHRWLVPDPMGEKYYDISPYAYCAGNPVMLVDPDGMDLTDYYSLTGKLLKHVEDGKDDKYLVLTDVGGRNKEAKVQAAIDEGNILPVPSNEVLDAMSRAFDLTESDGLERGFQVRQGGSLSSMVAGSEEVISNMPSVYQETGEYVVYDVHSHPKPSPGYNTNSGKFDRMITFYNREKDINTKYYSSFAHSVRRINSK